MSEFPALEASLLRAAHRRYGWRRWRPRGVVALVAAAAAGVTLLVARPPAPDDERAAVPRWTTVSVPGYGVDVSLPRGWSLAPATLTPNLKDPREILTATTFSATRLPVQGCTTVPAVALAKGAALVTVQERAVRVVVAPRPKRFAARPVSPVTGAMLMGCLPGAGSISYLAFADGMRSFDAFVALGPSASATVRGEAFGILDRLRFDPSFSPWW